MFRLDKVLLKKLYSWSLPGLLALIIIFIASFFLKLVIMPGRDMRQSINRGDVVLVKRTKSLFTRHSVIAFNFYSSDSIPRRQMFIQRCVGMPGDSLVIEEGFVYINGVEEPDNKKLQFNYRIKTRRSLAESGILDKYGLTEGGPISDELDYSYSLTKIMADSLNRDSNVVMIEQAAEKSGVCDEAIFPYSKKLNWNRYNMGPVYVPKKGDLIRLDTTSILFYSALITKKEGNTLRMSNDSIFINDEYAWEYEVKQNYYFVLGDNRDNAVDSRYWGYLSENDIIGKVLFTVLKRNRKTQQGD